MDKCEHKPDDSGVMNGMGICKYCGRPYKETSGIWKYYWNYMDKICPECGGTGEINACNTLSCKGCMMAMDCPKPGMYPCPKCGGKK